MAQGPGALLHRGFFMGKRTRRTSQRLEAISPGESTAKRHLVQQRQADAPPTLRQLGPQARVDGRADASSAGPPKAASLHGPGRLYCARYSSRAVHFRIFYGITAVKCMARQTSCHPKPSQLPDHGRGEEAGGHEPAGPAGPMTPPPGARRSRCTAWAGARGRAWRLPCKSRTALTSEQDRMPLSHRLYGKTRR